MSTSRKAFRAFELRQRKVGRSRVAKVQREVAKSIGDLSFLPAVRVHWRAIVKAAEELGGNLTAGARKVLEKHGIS